MATSELPVAFVGDAAHAIDPVLAQGGSIAIEDAVILGKCLAETERSPRKSLERYMLNRFNRTTHLRALSNVSQWIGQDGFSGSGLSVRNAFLGYFARTAILGAVFDRLHAAAASAGFNT